MESEIDSYLSGSHYDGPRTTEKSLFGEVFTPVSIVDTMLAMLPPSIWKRANTRWCDPACGIGHFPLKAIFGGAGYPGLLTSLIDQFPSRRAALKHIIENMLICYDINPENTRALRRKFTELCSGVIPQIFTDDFLESVAPDDKFDVIMGNPPYNSGGTKRVGEKRLHVRFTAVALDHLKPAGGHLLFVCPPNYREAGSSMNSLFVGTRGHFAAIRIYGPNETHRLFKVQTRVDCFLWTTGGGPSEKTHIVDEFGQTAHVKLDMTRHVPNFGLSIFEKLRAQPSVIDSGVKVFRTAEATTISCEKSGFSKTGSGRYPTLHLIVEEGRKILRRSRPHSLQTTPKLILNGLGIPYVFHDRDGKYGVTQTPIVIPNPPAKLATFMKSPLFYFIVWALRITGNNNLPYLFEDVPSNPATLTFTADERNQIEKFSVPEFMDQDNFIVCSAGRNVTRRRPRS